MSVHASGNPHHTAPPGGGAGMTITGTGTTDTGTTGTTGTTAGMTTTGTADTTTVTEDTDGTLHVGTQTVAPAVLALIITFLANKGRLIPAPSPGPLLQVFLSFKDVLACALRGDLLGAVGAFGAMLNPFFVFLGLKVLPKVSRRGAPSPVGFVAALNATANTLTKFPTETANAHQSAAVVSQNAADLNMRYTLLNSLKAGGEMVSRNIFPEAVAARDEMKSVVNVLDPILDTHPELVNAINDALRYLNDPHVRAAANNKKNRKKNAALVNKTTSQMLPTARNQVRGAVVQEINDAVSAVLSKD
jgi:hypothetical protein